MTELEMKATIEYLEKIKTDYIEGYGYEAHPVPEYYAIEDAIKLLEAYPRWILCSEQHPEISQTVLCQTKKGKIEFCKRTYDGWWTSEGSWVGDYYVVAWQPLPEPIEMEGDK